MDEIKVIILNDFNFVQGGASKVAIDTANMLANKGIETILFSACGESNKNTLYKDYCLNMHECLKDKNKLRGILNSCWNFKARKKLKQLLNQYDKSNTIIHVHGWTKALSSSVIDLCFRLGYRVVLTQHDYFSICPNGGCFNYKKNKICAISPFSLKCAFCVCDSRNYAFKMFRNLRFLFQDKLCNFRHKINYFVGISDFSFNIVKKYFPNIKIYKKINNPIDVKKYDRIYAELNDTYFYVGRLSKEKGVDIFCRAVSDMGLKGVVIGDGDEYTNLKQNYPTVDFLGWQSYENMSTYLMNARALVFPSLWYEGAPLTILENMAKGIPCIVADTCAGTEFVDNNVSGLYFKGGSLDDLKEKISICSDDKKVMSMSINSYDNYWNNPYDYERYYLSLLNFYRNILEDK